MKKSFLRTIAVLLALPVIALTGCNSNTPAETTATTEANQETEATTDATTEDNSLQNVLDAGKLVLGLDATFKPMGYTDENDNIVGYDIDLATEVCARMGVELVVQPINWDTKEQDLNSGNIDCIWNGMSINASRQEAMNLSDPYMKNTMAFVVKKDSGINSQADLAGKTVSVQVGSSAQDLLESAGLDITVAGLATNVECLQQLDLDLADAVFMDSVVANYEITTSNKDYVLLPDGLEEEEYAIGFRKNDQALRDEVQKTLDEMKADGKFAEISIKWFGVDTSISE